MWQGSIGPFVGYCAGSRPDGAAVGADSSTTTSPLGAASCPAVAVPHHLF